ncbi:MAG: helix-turn-helix domain-containing protein [Xanthobacteraceae bacterium]|nr:helix-turn-helix domain-containing protein [Xanthobacteraceae bacterium]
MNGEEPAPILITEKAAARLLSVSFRTLQTWRTQEKGPPFLRIGRAVRYESEAISSWVQRQRASCPKGAQ